MTVAETEYNLAETKRCLAELREWMTWLDKWHSTLGCELLALPAPRTRADAAKLADLQLSLFSIEKHLRHLDGAETYSLRSTRLAQLMINDGFLPQPINESLRAYGFLLWKGSRSECERKITAWEKQREKLEIELFNLTS